MGGEELGEVDIEERGEKERDGGVEDVVLVVEDCRRRKGREREGRRKVANGGRGSGAMVVVV